MGSVQGQGQVRESPAHHREPQSFLRHGAPIIIAHAAPTTAAYSARVCIVEQEHWRKKMATGNSNGAKPSFAGSICRNRRYHSSGWLSFARWTDASRVAASSHQNLLLPPTTTSNPSQPDRLPVAATHRSAAQQRALNPPPVPFHRAAPPAAPPPTGVGRRQAAASAGPPPAAARGASRAPP